MPKIRMHNAVQFLSPWVVSLALFMSPARAQNASDTTFESLAASAASAREAGKIDEAVRGYRAAVQLRPAWDEGWWYLGTMLYDSDHFAEAAPALHRFVELDPNVGPGWAFLGLSEFETGNYSESFIHLRKAHELGFSESPDVEKVSLYHLALLQNLNGEFDQAIELLKTAFGNGRPPDQIRTAMGLALLRVPLLPAQVDPAKDALIHAAGDAAVLLASTETKIAIKKFESMLQDFPGTPYLHYQYGKALMAEGQDQAAEQHFREEARINPASALPWTALSILDTRKQKFGEAKIAAQQALQLSPRSPAAARAVSQATDGGKSDKGAVASTQGVESPDEPVDSTQAARYSLNRDSTPGFGSQAPVAGNHAAENFDEVAAQASSARQSGQLPQAATLYRSALSLRPSWQEGWRQLGTVAYMQGDYPVAITALRQAVARETRQPDTWTLLGLSEFETKDYKNALIHLELGRSLGFSGNAAAVRVSRYQLALLLNLNGEFDKAISLLVPEFAAGDATDEIQFAMGMALLRIPALPQQVSDEMHQTVLSAGMAGGFLSQSFYSRAFPIFDKLIQEHPRTPFLHYAYGDALASLSRYEEAQVQLRQEIQQNPESELAYLRLATIDLALHNTANAVADASRGIGVAPESAEGHYVLGRAFLEDGNPNAAIRELETARRFAPSSPKVHFNLAKAYARASRAAEAQQERAEFVRLNGESKDTSLYSGVGIRSAENSNESIQKK